MERFIAERIVRSTFGVSLVLLMFAIGFSERLSADEGFWPPQGPLHQDENLNRMGPEVTIRADCQGVPVYAFGYTYIYGLSPDFEPVSTLQVGNTAPLRKIVPKKSWEITSNRIGATPPRMPRTASHPLFRKTSRQAGLGDRARTS